jgi:hypothetical protein
MNERWTTEEIEVRVWAVIVLSLTSILLLSTFGIIVGVMFVEHDMTAIAPIDEHFPGYP